MNLPFYIARRYLFSKKSQNAINIISLISVLSLAAGTAALVCVMSVFNGFEDVVGGLFSNFDPQVKITVKEGKVFDATSLKAVEEMPEVEYFDEVLSDNALLQFRNKQMPVKVKGVGDNYGKINRIDDIMIDGEFLLKSGDFDLAVGGVILTRNLGAGMRFVEPMYLYAPKREGRVNLLSPDNSFRREAVFYAGTFMVQQEQYDQNLLIVPIDLARRLFDYETEVSAVEVKLHDGVNERQCIKKMQELAGSDFVVANRYQQQEDVYKMMQVEKWITYLILSFILLVALFNLVGTMTMLILDKQENLELLQKLGFTVKDSFKLFLWEGGLITFFGAIIGMVIGLALCLIQEYFGVITLASDYIVSSYPVSVHFTDLVIIFVTVCIMGFAVSSYPASRVLKYAAKS